MYKSMWAYNKDYPVDDHEGCMARVTYESGVASGKVIVVLFWIGPL
jgi:hypothetical protein